MREKFVYNTNGKLIMEQVKDIQLYFNEFTREKKDSEDIEFCSCLVCYNNPCTCNGRYDVKYSKNIGELEKVKVVKKENKQDLKKQFEIKPYEKEKGKWECNEIIFQNKKEAEEYSTENIEGTWLKEEE